MKAAILAAICVSVLIACDPPKPAADPTVDPTSTGAETMGHDHHAMDHGKHAAHQHEVMPAGDIVPGSSMYQLDVALVAHDGRPRTWKDFAGHEMIVSMVYSSCTTACPMIVAEIKHILHASGRNDLPVLLVSMDPERDTPEALAGMKAKHSLSDNWTLVRAPDDDVREITAALGVRYRKLPNGDFNHSQIIALLDAEGSIIDRAEGLGPQRETLIAKLRGD